MKSIKSSHKIIQPIRMIRNLSKGLSNMILWRLTVQNETSNLFTFKIDPKIADFFIDFLEIHQTHPQIANLFCCRLSIMIISDYIGKFNETFFQNFTDITDNYFILVSITDLKYDTFNLLHLFPRILNPNIFQKLA